MVTTNTDRSYGTVIVVISYLFVVIVGCIDSDDVTQIDDVNGKCSHVIARHGFARHSADNRRHVQLAAPSDDCSGVADRGDRFRRAVPSRSTLPPSLVGTRCCGDGDSQITSSPTGRGRVAFTDVDIVVIPNPVAASSSNSSSRVAEVEGQRAVQMSMGREQRGSEAAVGRRSASSTISHIAPPPRTSSKSKSSSQPSQRLTSSAAVGDTQQAKKGERLSNYNKGPMPPTRLRTPKSPQPVAVVTTFANGWANGVSSPLPNRHPWQSAKRPCGSLAMDALAEDPGELPPAADQPRLKSKNSPKHRSKQLELLKLNSPNLRPRTQSKPTGSDLRPSKHGHSSVLMTLIPTEPASTVTPGHSDVAEVSSSTDSSFPPTPNGANGMIPGSSPGAWISKLPAQCDSDTRSYPFQFHRFC